MKKIFLIFSITLVQIFCVAFLNAQNITQTIRGVIIDKQSKEPLVGVMVSVQNITPALASLTDNSGKFHLNEVAVGRYDLKVKLIGYKELILPNIEVSAGKEVVLEIEMEESTVSLKEVAVTATKKNETQNQMVSVSGRSFSMEEVNRYAGGRSDPARLAANFAGVSSPDDSRNDLVIRGNSPTGVLWRIDGLNIPNPNHFATITSTGGPVSAINTNMLKNSDFFTSAFPAEYGNANAGVFDLGFRSGNSEKRESTFQLGALTGIEAMTEGPLGKTDGASYLLAYRYSFTGVAQKIGIPIGTAATPFYQDLSFKINGLSSPIGTFSLFGIGATSHINFDHNKIDATDLFANPSADSYFGSDIGVFGIKHTIRVNDKSYFNTVLGATYTASTFTQDSVILKNNSTYQVVDNTTKQMRYSLNTSYNSKISSRLFLKIGFTDELVNLKLFYKTKLLQPGWVQVWDYNDYTQLMQGYVQAKYNFNDNLTLNLGLHSQYLTLNNTHTVEPRVGLKYQLNTQNALSFGYGLHSQMQTPDVYFYRQLKADGTYDNSNKNLDFTKSQHLVIGYDLLPAPEWRIKTEVYYQMLFNVPVTSYASSFSMLNAGASFNPTNQGELVNNGKGKNYGVELTLEKFYSQGFYTLITGSLYQSKYTGSDGIERNTAFNGRYVYNILAGKEFKIGAEKRHRITLDVKLTQAGGRYYTPVDLAASQVNKIEVLKGDAYSFSMTNPAFFRLDVKAGLVLNSKKRHLSQSWFFDIQNITNNKNVFAQRYNPVTNQVNTAYQIGLFPNFVYRLQF